MALTLARCILAALLIAAHVPLQAPRATAQGHGGPMACCAPKSCCMAGHVCTMGGGCWGADATRSGSGPWMIAGGCQDQTAQVTPVQLDPTVTAQVIGLAPASFTRRAFPGFDARGISLVARPLVPPPRA
ncbi:MAG: hypothetical protein E6K79_11405 [Candidatus Eisenbacteria bacterium]|uniref:Uncharacterized protein n=1 Tax=Eiseniibacteriota bacterium TaxID=2212470 RepID=A0A538TGU5_UNCEI|nr:MAG: hypothetical protein E6K79_11405 [Candidatus Eisenbacteria bacterium]